MTEAEQIAAETWELMVRPEEPMPPEVALDRVQDVTDDRERAATLLRERGRLWLESQMPPPPNDLAQLKVESGFRLRKGATTVCRSMCSDFNYPQDIVNRYVFQLSGIEDIVGPAAVQEWKEWAELADAAHRLVRTLKSMVGTKTE